MAFASGKLNAGETIKITLSTKKLIRVIILIARLALRILGRASKNPIIENALLGIKGFPKRSSKIP